MQFWVVLLAVGSGIAQSVSVATDCAAKFRFPIVETVFFFYFSSSRTSLGPTQPPIQWGTVCSFSGGKVTVA
jgi:hypothetical protein